MNLRVKRLPQRGDDRPSTRITGVVLVLTIASLACARTQLPMTATQSATTARAASDAVPHTAAGTEIPVAAYPTPMASATPAPFAWPTAAVNATPGETLLYTTQAGDTLVALAFRFGVSMGDIQSARPLTGDPLLDPGQLLLIPKRLEDTSPSTHLIPDSELVFSASAAGFNVQDFVNRQGGYTSGRKGFVGGMTLSGARTVERVAFEHSVNPQVLLGLVEYYATVVASAPLGPEALLFPMEYPVDRDKGLYHQVAWAAQTLNEGYYGWRLGELTQLMFKDRSTLRLAPDLNAGTVALLYFFSLNHTQQEWYEIVSQNGFIASYLAWFGDPFDRAIEPLLAKGLTQPMLELPFQPGVKWAFTGGPHGAWEREGVIAAIDFGPPAAEGGCTPSEEWATAAAPGLVVRAGDGALMLDLDGDGREQTGWVLFYMHVAAQDRVPVGTVVETGDLLGHPSCEGGFSTGTHLHFARKYNGEWMPIAGPLPFELSGWRVRSGLRPYYGYLEKDGLSVASCFCSSPSSFIWR